MQSSYQMVLVLFIFRLTQKSGCVVRLLFCCASSLFEPHIHRTICNLGSYVHSETSFSLHVCACRWARMYIVCMCACMLWHVLCASVCASVWVWVCDKMYSARKLLFSCTQMECVELVMHLMDFFFFPPVGHQDPNCGQTRAISIQTPCRRFRAQDAAGENKENGHLMMTLLT